MVCPDCREEYYMDEHGSHRVSIELDIVSFLINYLKSWCPGKSDLVIHEERQEFGRSSGASRQSYGDSGAAALAKVALKVDKSHHTDHVPCEVCDEPIEFQNFDNHMVLYSW